MSDVASQYFHGSIHLCISVCLTLRIAVTNNFLQLYILQYQLGNSSYIAVPGGADARNIAICGFEPYTPNNLSLRAVNNFGNGDDYEHAEINTLGEFNSFNTISYV